MSPSSSGGLMEGREGGEWMLRDCERGREEILEDCVW